MPDTPPSRSAPARLRRWLWRQRRLVAAVCLGLAAAVSVATLRPPPPPTAPALVLARAVPAGQALTSADVTVASAPVGAHPPEVLTTEVDAVGLPLAVGLPAGSALTPAVLVGPGLADGAPPGTVVVPVPVADRATAELARPGQRVDLLSATADSAGTPGPADVVARDVVVLASFAGEQGGLLDPGVSGVTVLYVAAPRAVASVLVGSSAWAPLRAVLAAS